MSLFVATFTRGHLVKDLFAYLKVSNPTQIVLRFRAESITAVKFTLNYSLLNEVYINTSKIGNYKWNADPHEEILFGGMTSDILNQLRDCKKTDQVNLVMDTLDVLFIQIVTASGIVKSTINIVNMKVEREPYEYIQVNPYQSIIPNYIGKHIEFISMCSAAKQIKSTNVFLSCYDNGVTMTVSDNSHINKGSSFRASNYSAISTSRSSNNSPIPSNSSTASITPLDSTSSSSFPVSSPSVASLSSVPSSSSSLPTISHTSNIDSTVNSYNLQSYKEGSLVNSSHQLAEFQFPTDACLAASPAISINPTNSGTDFSKSVRSGATESQTNSETPLKSLADLGIDIDDIEAPINHLLVNEDSNRNLSEGDRELLLIEMESKLIKAMAKLNNVIPNGAEVNYYLKLRPHNPEDHIEFMVPIGTIGVIIITLRQRPRS